MTKAASKIRAHRKRQPVYLTVHWVIVEATGERVPGFLPTTPTDQELCRERRYRVGTTLRAQLAEPRDIGQHRKLHALGKLLAEQLDDFHGKTGHEAIKKLQEDSGVACETNTYELPGLGELKRREARSIAFDEMPNDEFEEMVDGLLEYVRGKYWPDLDVESVVELYEHRIR